MTPDAEDLLSAVLELPEPDRLEVVEALLVSFQSTDEPPFDEVWREVILRRSAELDSGSVSPISWAEVKKRARESIGG